MLTLPWGSLALLLLTIAAWSRLLDGALKRLQMRPLTAGLFFALLLFGRGLPISWGVGSGLVVPVVGGLLLGPSPRTVGVSLFAATLGGTLLSLLPNEPGMFPLELEYLASLVIGASLFAGSRSPRAGLAGGLIAGGLQSAVAAFFARLQGGPSTAVGAGLFFEVALVAALLSWGLTSLLATPKQASSRADGA